MGDAFSHPGCESDKISSIWAGKENTRARGLTVPLKGHTVLALEEENV